MDIENRIEKELSNAELSRRQGNEGMARVCARRAAGLALRDYLAKKDLNFPELNNYELMADEGIRRYVPASALAGLNNLTMKVDEQHRLPGDIDLIADARDVIQLFR